MDETTSGRPTRAGSATLVLGGGLALFLLAGVLSAGPASAEPAVLAFPATGTPAAGDELPCLPTNPFCAIGELAGAVVTDVWISAMTSLWEAGLWVLGLAFSVIDALTTPDLSADGPLGEVYPVTFGIGAAVAALMAMVQLGSAAVRRDGQTLGRVLIGLAQFGLVWAGYVGVAALLVTGVGGLTTGLLRGLLEIDSLAAFDSSLSVERDLVNGTVATVLGMSSVFLLFPAAAGYLLLMLIREAALMLLAATSAISAGGLLAETSSAWFWKSLRWFIAALLISPLAVLILGVGVAITEGVVSGNGSTSSEAAIGMAVIGCLLILIGAVCPLILFRLLAFVDPGTSSGTAMRQSLAASGGVLGVLQGGRARTDAVSGGVAGSGAAARVTGGRAQGESTAEGVTGGRFAGAVRALATGSAQVGQLAAGAASAGSDLLSGAGVGHQAPYYGQPAPSRGAVPGGRERSGAPVPLTGEESRPAPPPAPPQPPPPPPPPPPPRPSGPPPDRASSTQRPADPPASGGAR
ncbi:hypothetical protein [Blastococcus tunisiensis]|uniref:TrbL/VirB6 plasmid conjugal transfer protein n=1 Tax=Blastococcus tunisiensis TaxID=1798228 RepID=A0A1I2ERV5_9ACTN|nr:hypothetical protein [Blastococcus sp. DSM 46838]SFE95569.1 hypothetical protein SAMN05216574_107166 [Blastococcus sp. DSM 46838]